MIESLQNREKNKRLLRKVLDATPETGEILGWHGSSAQALAYVIEKGYLPGYSNGGKKQVYIAPNASMPLSPWMRQVVGSPADMGEAVEYAAQHAFSFYLLATLKKNKQKKC